MKRPKPRDYGLDSDHPTSDTRPLGVDPDQPLTEEELFKAYAQIIQERALDNRKAVYRRAVDEWDWNYATR